MKNELRKKYLSLRSSKDEAELKKCSEKIIDNLYTLEEFLKAETIMVYVSFKSEVETSGLIKKLSENKKRICVPLCKSDDFTMTAREITGFSDLARGAYGILEPGDAAPVIPKDEIDFIIVPGCAFSKDGHRIGYGKGYYDRFLKDTNAVSCGLCYDFCLAEALPTEETDIPLDIIITQSSILKLPKA